MTVENMCPIRKKGQTKANRDELTEINQLNSSEKRDLLRLLMGRLPYVDRVALALRFWENCSIEEISNFLGMEWDETDRRLNRSFKVLKQALKEFSEKRPLTELNQTLGLKLKAA